MTADSNTHAGLECRFLPDHSTWNQWLYNMGSYNVVLMYPKTGLDVGGHTVAPPHALLAVAAPVDKAGYSVKIIDMRRDYEWRNTLKESLGPETLCVGISSMTGTQVRFALRMAEEARKLTNGKIPIVFGGAHATSLPEQTAEHPLVDIVVKGEGDESFPELVKALDQGTPWEAIPGLVYQQNGQMVKTAFRPLLNIEDLLPVPWHLIDVEQYINIDNYFLKDSPRTLDVGQTSRGCPHMCTFCSSASSQGRKWRAMSVEKSMEFILDPVKKFNLTGVWIRDDEFYVNRKRAFEICRRIIKSGHEIQWYATGARVSDFIRMSPDEIELLKTSGGQIMKFGAESGSNRVLEYIRKGITVEQTIQSNLRCKEFGIIPAYSFIVGFPSETFEEIDQTIDLAFSLQKDYKDAQLETFPTCTSFPGTEMWTQALEMGLKPPESLDQWADWIMDDYDIAGQRIPWFNKKERIWIGNISYMSILANAIGNVGAGISHPVMRMIFMGILKPMQAFYRFRLKNKWYRFAPELAIARYLRRKLFYERERNFS